MLLIHWQLSSDPYEEKRFFQLGQAQSPRGAECALKLAF
jgi:hypothetical protein